MPRTRGRALALGDGSSTWRNQRRSADLEPADEDRTPAQHDRDRLLYSSAFRRLAAVTQVVAASEGRVFHNRLTHTIEVAQIAQRLATRIRNRTNAQIQAELQGLDPDAVEAAALAHDLGHPPFGHVAEMELDDLLTKAQFSDGFEGNAQSFRIVTKLAVRYWPEAGLNLTPATLNALLKYPWLREGEGYRHRKWGVYHSEREEFDRVRRRLVGPKDQKTLEAELMDWADDIAYAVGDTEDFYRAGLIPLDRFPFDEEAVKSYVRSVFARRERKALPLEFAEEDGVEAFARVAEYFPQRPYRDTPEVRASLRSFTSRLIARYMGQISARRPTPENPRTVEIKQTAEVEIAMLKELTWEYVIDNPSLATQQLGQRRLVRELFNIFDTVAKDQTAWFTLPIGMRLSLEAAQKYPGSQDHHRMRVVVDAIASMSDDEAVQMYHRLTGISLGSALTSIL